MTDIKNMKAFTAAPVTTEAPERGQYANKVYDVDPKLATAKQLHALIYAISSHAISSKELHLPNTTYLTKDNVKYLFDKINAAPVKHSNYYHYTLINNWFAKQYKDHSLEPKHFNEFKKEQYQLQNPVVHKPKKTIICDPKHCATKCLTMPHDELRAKLLKAVESGKISKDYKKKALQYHTNMLKKSN